MLSSASARRAVAGEPGWDSTALLYGEPIETLSGPVSGRALILVVEDVYNRLSAKSLQRNPFWRAMVDHPALVPVNVFYGMCIENYNLLYRESYFDSPALSFAFSEKLRLKFNKFYCEELGHDRLLLRALQSIGMGEETLFGSVPLRETMALCNALAYWARHDPLFFFTTLGPLEGRDVEVDSYVLAARAAGLPDSFLGPIETHARINKDSSHGFLTRELFEAVDVVSSDDAARILRQTALFIALYDQFYAAIWRHYTHVRTLLRPLAEI
jgi:hypothetical protein